MYFTSSSAKLLVESTTEYEEVIEWYRPRKHCRRHWLLLAQSILILIALLVVMCMPNMKQYNIATSRPQVHGVSPKLSGFINNAADYEQSALVTILSVCHDTIDVLNEPLQFVWTFREKIIGNLSSEKDIIIEVVSTDCSLRWRAPKAGQYIVALNVWVIEEFKDTRVRLLATSQKYFDVTDIWLAVLGDSFAAGQGNPDSTEQMFGLVQAKWLNKVCARSSGSFSYKLYESLLHQQSSSALLFTYLACSGASVRNGLLRAGPDETSQVKKLELIVNASSRHGVPRSPDYLVITIGANDIGFSEILDLLARNASQTKLRRMVGRRFMQLERQLNLLGDRVNRAVGGTAVYLMEYYSSSMGDGHETSCYGNLNRQSPSYHHLQYIDQIVMELNDLLRTSARNFNWNYVSGVFEAFKGHGVCSRESYLLTSEMSIERQGNPFGAFHPNQRGHENVKGLLRAAMAF